MADPARKPNYDINPDINPDIKPDLKAIQGGGETSPRQGKLSALDKLEGGASGAPTGSASDREQQASNVIQGPWADNTSGAVATASKVASGGKTTSPLVAILILLFGGGFTFAGLFGALSLLPIDLVAQFMDKYDTQNTSMTIRTNKLINAKISRSATAGSCKIVQIACRFTLPSNTLLKALAREGVQAFDGKGNLIEPRKLLPNTRPAEYRFTDSAGNQHRIPASKFAETLDKNPEFRALFHKAYTPRVVGYLDSVYKIIKDKFNFRSSDKLAGTKDNEDANKRINESVKVPDTGASKAAGAEISTIVEKEITAVVEKEVKKVGESSKGNAVGAVAGIICLVGDVPGITIATVRGFQLVQLIKYGAVILSAIGAIKAGDATAEEATAIGALLTTVVDGKSALDSFGIKHTLFGDNIPFNNNYRKFSPGSSAVSLLGGVATITDSDIKKEACAVATNPATGAAIDLATSETIIGPAINFIGGVAISVAISQIAPKVIPGIISFLTTFVSIEDVLKFFLGDLTQNLSGEPVGDAFTSSISHVTGQTANAGGNSPLSVEDAVDYANVTQQVNIAYAEEDRATHSPFDPTNRNTLVGSFVSQLLPYYSKLGSLSGVFSTISSVVTGSLSRITTVNAKGDPSYYKMCDDPAIKDKVAAGPYCNIYYGVPTKYLGREPEDVMKRLLAKGDIDAETGEPVDKSNPITDVLTIDVTSTGNLKKWLDLCTDGSSLEANNCKITDDTADYALYTIDHRIQKTMDGEDTSYTPPVASTTEAYMTTRFDNLSSTFNAFDASISKSIQSINTTVSSTIESSDFSVGDLDKKTPALLPNRRYVEMFV